MARISHGHGFVALRVEGGLLPAEFLQKVAALDAEYQAAGDYGLAKGLNLKDEIGRAWRIAKAEWLDARNAARENASKGLVTSLDRWWRVILQDVLCYRDVAPRQPIIKGDRVFPVAFDAFKGAVPFVLAGGDIDLERPDPQFGDEHRKRSPHALMQEFLNAEDAALWGIVGNGRKLRLLRDNPSLTRPAYLEADLERMFDEDLYADFAAFWLAFHASRLEPRDRRPENAVIEIWRTNAHKTGERALANLRNGVTDALRELGNGFIAHRDNVALRQALTDRKLTETDLFQELLRLVYRMLFLFTAEERGLLHAPGATAESKGLYLRGYSLARLRDLALRRRNYDEHADLWLGMRIVFRGLSHGAAQLALPGLGGLFGAEQCPDLDGASLGNAYLLRAVRALSFFASEAVLTRVNYRDMGTEELGSVYESLLELRPYLEVETTPWRFRFVGDSGEQQGKGSARKLSGSYYTPQSLVQELIGSTLEPVLSRTVKENPSDPVAGILRLKVIDPACGSGHFLLAAARRLAAEIARIRSASDVPDEETRRHALREVVRHCIYGVDKNPLSVELCRTGLWIETIEPGKPLSFLDVHIRCGDSLVGVFEPKILEEGIPQDAYKPLSGDDKETCTFLKAENKKVKLGKPIQGDLFDQEGFQRVAEAAVRFEALPEDSVDQVEAKRKAWEEARSASRNNQDRLRADLFTAAFMAEKSAATKMVVPTNDDLNRILARLPGRSGVADFVRNLAVKHQIFHWFLEFPEVMKAGGFDIVLGNPPWERIKIQEQEFFGARSPVIATAMNQAERGKLIKALARSDATPSEKALWNEFQEAKHDAEAASQYVRTSGRFPLTGCGDVNTYALFSELFLRLPRGTGRSGLIVPSGIATDDSTKKLFGEVAGKNRLARLADFENRGGLFPEVDSRMKFALLTIGQNESRGLFSFFAQQVSDLDDPRRVFSLSGSDVALINPNTNTCPVFRTTADAELTKMIYRRIPVLINEADQENGNPWGIRFQAMFHMSNDSGLFKTYEQLSSTGGLELRGNRFVRKGVANPGPADLWLPLYEAKMIHQFDHRWATYAGSPSTSHWQDSDADEGDGKSRNATPEEKASPDFQVLPRYWLPAEEVFLRIANLPKGLLQGLRDHDPEIISLALADLLFSKFLNSVAKGGCENALKVLLPSWKDFLVAQPFARAFTPLQFGLCGDNSTSFQPAGPCYLPIKSLEEMDKLGPRSGGWVEADSKQVADFLQYAVPYQDFLEPIPKLESQEEAVSFAWKCLMKASPRWLMGWRDITNSTNERTVIASLLPLAAVGHTSPLFFLETPSPALIAAFLACVDSLLFDFNARQKLGGTHLTYSYLKQFPTLPPSAFSPFDMQIIIPRVLELIYCSNDMRAFTGDILTACASEGVSLPSFPSRRAGENASAPHIIPPFVFSLDRRALLRAELDAYYAYLYGLNRKQLRYILDPADLTAREIETILDPHEEVADPLDQAAYEARAAASDFPGETFRVLKERELREFGEYRTRRLVLEAWTRFVSDGTFARRGPPPDFSAQIAQAAARAAAAAASSSTSGEAADKPAKKADSGKTSAKGSKTATTKKPSPKKDSPSSATSSGQPTMGDLFAEPAPTVTPHTPAQTTSSHPSITSSATPATEAALLALHNTSVPNGGRLSITKNPDATFTISTVIGTFTTILARSVSLPEAWAAVQARKLKE